MDSIRDQFQKEAQAVLQIINDLVDAEQYNEASQLLDQYTLLNPTDPQIAKLRKKINAGGATAAGGQNDAKDSPGAVTTTRPKYLDNTESIYIVSGLGTKRTGVFTSIFGKVKLMEEKFGYNSTILLCRHDIDLRKTEVWLKTFIGNSSILGPGTKILSIYEYFQKSYAEGLENKAIYSRSGDEDGLRYEALSEKTYAVYDGDKRIRLDVYTGYSGSLRIERYYDGETTLKEHYYDDWGYLNSVREFKDGNTETFTAKYYTTDGKLCLSADFDTVKDSNEPQKVYIHDGNGDIGKECASNHELAAYYFKQTMADDEENGENKYYLLIYEAGMVSEIAGFLGKSIKNVAQVTVVHSIFLKNAYDLKSPPQMYYEYVCKHPQLYDGIVLLTRGARRDFNNLYGQHKSTFVIPHPYPYEIEPVPFEQRDNKKAVVIGRLFPEKQLEITVDIFSAVVKRIPDAKLEIYGTGPERERIETRIKRHKMENNIFLMGYTDDPITIYRSAVLSIMTSVAEGYGLVLMESICNGCPAFAHDIKYGPADIVKDGETGFLFKRGDKEKFARQMIKYFENEDMQRTMSENCYADTPRFGQDVFLERWLGMVEEVVKN